MKTSPALASGFRSLGGKRFLHSSTSRLTGRLRTIRSTPTSANGTANCTGAVCRHGAGWITGGRPVTPRSADTGREGPPSGSGMIGTYWSPPRRRPAPAPSHRVRPSKGEFALHVRLVQHRPAEMAPAENVNRMVLHEVIGGFTVGVRTAVDMD